MITVEVPLDVLRESQIRSWILYFCFVSSTFAFSFLLYKLVINMKKSFMVRKKTKDDVFKVNFDFGRISCAEWSWNC